MYFLFSALLLQSFDFNITFYWRALYLLEIDVDPYNMELEVVAQLITKNRLGISKVYL